MLPGGHELRPLLTEQQKTVHPDEQLESGPQSDAYAVPGRSKNRNGFTASAEPTSAERNKNPRRLVLVARPLLIVVTTFSATLMRRCSLREVQGGEHRVDLGDDAAQVQTTRNHDVETERPFVRGEEQLATHLAGERPL